MLKLAQRCDEKLIFDFCRNDLIGTRIACYTKAYGFDNDFFSVWINIIDADVKCLVAKFYDSITVKAIDGCEINEINAFCEMLSFSDLVCDSKTAELLRPEISEIKKSYVFRGNADGYSLPDIGEEYYKQLYALVSENISGSFENRKEAYLAWLSDFTFRKRRKLARCKGVAVDSILHSSVVTSCETENSALLSAVVTSNISRGKGLGKITVLSMTNELKSENKEVYVIALNSSAEGFYEHIGFEFLEYIYFCKNRCKQ